MFIEKQDILLDINWEWSLQVQKQKIKVESTFL